MDKNELIAYLKEALSIEVKQEKGLYGEKHTEIVLTLECEQISSDYLDLDL